MKNRRASEAKRLWKELCESISKKPSPFIGMTKDQVIKILRRTREKLWEEKFAIRT